jgi:GT2 family glycosyltransferase
VTKFPLEPADTLGNSDVRVSEKPRPLVSDLYGRPLNMASELASIVIPVFNEVTYTKLCVDSIIRNTDYPYELIIIDNGSIDSTAEYLGKLQDITVISNETNLGVPKAFNQGIRASRGRYVMILNNDTIVTPHWLSRMVCSAERDDKIGVVTAVTNHGDESQRDENATYSGIRELNSYAEERARKFAGIIFVYPRVGGLALLIKRELLRRIGLFDEDFSPGNYEDDDFFVRTLMAGFDIAVAQDVFIHHFGERTFRGSKMAYRDILERNRRLFQKKWGPSAYDDALLKKFRCANDMPLVSIIMPTHNPEFLNEAVKSVLDQTHQRFELIVVNEGGAGVSHTLEKFADGRICCINSERHVGTAAARNLGLMQARGEFVAYLDDDSRYYPNHLETLLAALTTTSCTVAYGSCRCVIGGGVQRNSRSGPVNFDYSKDRLLVINYIPIVSVMHRRNLQDAVRVFDESLRFHEDWDFLIRLAQTTFFYHSDKTTLEIRTRAESACVADQGLRLEAAREIYRRHQPVPSSESVTRARLFLLLLGRLGMLDRRGNAKMKALLSMCHRATKANRQLGRFINNHMIPLHLRSLGLLTSQAEKAEV